MTSNEWPWRLARTIVQGVLGVATALAVLCLGMLPFLPLLWLVGRFNS